MRNFFRPTLVRRVFLTLLLTFFLAWLVLMALILLLAVDEKTEIQELRELSDYASENLAELDNADAAKGYIAGLLEGTDRFNYATRKATVWAQMEDAEGHIVFSNFHTLKDVSLREISAGVREQSVRQGIIFVRAHNTHWTLTLARHRHTWLGVLLDEWAAVSSALLIAFPLIFLPIWFAVSRGLRPLRRFSEQIAARKADDLSALNADLKYAELKPLAGALDDLLLQLRNKIAREHAFVQDAAHELRTPMAVISAQAHVLAMATTPELRLQAELQLDRAIARASHLIRQLLELARLDQSRTRQEEMLDLAQLLRQELALSAPAAMARNSELSLEAPDTLPLTLEREVFLSVLHNLVDNAIRYTQRGGQIDVELQQQDNAVILKVSDNGPGIAEQARASVFERFHRGVDHEVSGSGLGLALVKQAVERLRGTITLTSGPDNTGCQFTVTLPNQQAEIQSDGLD